METRTTASHDQYTTLADLLCETAKDLECQQHMPVAIGNWNVGQGYGEGIYLHCGSVWREYGPSGMWAAYDKTANYERSAMDDKQVAELLRHVAISEPQELLSIMDRIRRLRTGTK